MTLLYLLFFKLLNKPFSSIWTISKFINKSGMDFKGIKSIILSWLLDILLSDASIELDFSFGIRILFS